MSDVRQALIELAQKLPDGCTWDDVMYQIYVRQKIEDGLRAAEAGELVDHDEVFKEFEE